MMTDKQIFRVASKITCDRFSDCYNRALSLAKEDDPSPKEYWSIKQDLFNQSMQLENVAPIGYWTAEVKEYIYKLDMILKPIWSKLIELNKE